MIRISDAVSIYPDELKFSAARSSGPGGQHVNKVNTRITLWFDVGDSPSLNEFQKARIMSRLKTRISKEGRLRIVSQRHRSQSANREAAVEKFVELIKEALTNDPVRKKTKVSQKSRQKRLKDKKHQSMIKKYRSRVVSGDDN